MGQKAVVHRSHVKPITPADYVASQVPDYASAMRAAAQPVDPQEYLDLAKEHYILPALAPQTRPVQPPMEPQASSDSNNDPPTSHGYNLRPRKQKQ